MVEQPLVRAEVFPEPAFFDDHFAKGDWSNWQATHVSDGDKVTVTLTATDGGIVRTGLPAMDSTVYKYIIVKCDSFNTTNWRVEIRLAGVIKGSFVFSDAGVKNILLTEQYSGTFDEIALCGVGASGNTFVIDYVAVCKRAQVVPIDEGETVEKLEWKTPLLSRDIPGAELTLRNFEGEWTDQIKKFDIILLYAWRAGEEMKKVFGGRISLPRFESSLLTSEKTEDIQAVYYVLGAVGHADELASPPNLMWKRYLAVSGKTICSDFIDLCDYIAKHPNVTDTSKVGWDPHDDFTSTHDVTFEGVDPYDGIVKVADAGKTIGGLVGFDAYVEPAGVATLFRRGRFSSDREVVIWESSKEDDILRVKNKQAVFGAAKKNNPTDKDAWTEPTADPPPDWVSDGTLSRDTDRVIGTYSVKSTRTDTSLYMRRDNIGTIKAQFLFEFRKLKFRLKWDHSVASVTNPYSLQVSLFAPDAANSFDKMLRFGTVYGYAPAKNEWGEYALELGPDQEHPSGYIGWKKTGSPSWENIQAIWFYYGDIYNAGTFTLKIDNLHFTEARYYGFSSNSVSQAKYKVRWAKPVIDSSLESDAECQTKAESLISQLATELETFELTIEGRNDFYPGFAQKVVMPKAGISDYYRIVNIKDKIVGPDWKTTLEFLNEPMSVSSIVTQMDSEAERIERLATERGVGVTVGRGEGGGGGTGGPLIIENRTSDPADAVEGRCWIRTDL